MTRFTLHQPTAHPGGGTSKCLACGIVLIILVLVPGVGPAAEWLAPAAGQTLSAPWVKDIVARLDEHRINDFLAKAPGAPPHPALVRYYLNRAAQAVHTGNQQLAQFYIDRTTGVFDSGVLRGYYSRAEVEPIKRLIREKAKAAMKGEKLPVARD